MTGLHWHICKWSFSYLISFQDVSKLKLPLQKLGRTINEMLMFIQNNPLWIQCIIPVRIRLIEALQKFLFSKGAKLCWHLYFSANPFLISCFWDKFSVHKQFSRYIYFPTLPLRTICNIRSTFKWSTAGLKLEFSFSETDCLIKAKELSLPSYLPIAAGEMNSCLSVGY